MKKLEKSRSFTFSLKHLSDSKPYQAGRPKASMRKIEKERISDSKPFQAIHPKSKTGNFAKAQKHSHQAFSSLFKPFIPKEKEL